VLVTGASSQLGQLVIKELCSAGYAVVALTRNREGEERLEGLRYELSSRMGQRGRRLESLRGDILEPDLGLGSAKLAELAQITEIMHLARPRCRKGGGAGELVRGFDAVMGATRKASSLRRAVVLTSTDITGDYPGLFYEDWLDVGQHIERDSARAAFELELRCRDASAKLPVVLARRALLVGHSHTGAIDCDAGLGRLILLGQKLARLPSWARPPIPADGDRFLLVSPVDFLARALVEVLRSPLAKSGDTFCLADPEPPTIAELFELVLARSGAPEPGLRVPIDGKGALGLGVGIAARTVGRAASALRVGSGLSSFFELRGAHDTGNATRLLGPTGITCPRLGTYLDALISDYVGRDKRRK